MKIEYKRMSVKEIAKFYFPEEDQHEDVLLVQFIMDTGKFLYQDDANETSSTVVVDARYSPIVPKGAGGRALFSVYRFWMNEYEDEFGVLFADQPEDVQKTFEDTEIDLLLIREGTDQEVDLLTLALS